MHQERCARKAAWDLASNIYKLKNSDKATFYIPGEVKGMSTPITSKRPEEREFEVDSGPSMHMMSKRELSSEKVWTVKKRSRTPTVALIANGEVHTHEDKCSFMTRISSLPCNYSRKRLLSYPLASFVKTTDTPMSGSAVKSHN